MIEHFYANNANPTFISLKTTFTCKFKVLLWFHLKATKVNVIQF